MMEFAARGDREIKDLGLGEFLQFGWRSRWLIFGVTSVFTIAAAVTASLVPRKYEGSVLLMPVNSQSAPAGLGGLASVVSQLGGVASLAGLNVSATGSQKAESIATLQSQVIAERYIHERNLLPVLFSKNWDRTRQRWISDDPKKIPTLWQGMVLFHKQVLNVLENSKTGLVELTVTWTDPTIAATWANDLVKVTNEYLRDKAIRESQRNIDYLNEQAAKTPTMEVRSAIFTVMATEIKKAMVARGSEEFALKVVDPAIPPERQSYPRPLLWTFGGFVIGLMCGTTIAVVKVVLADGNLHT